MITLGLICCLAELSYAVVNVLAIPAFVSREKGVGEYVGVIMGAFLLAEALGRLGMGALSDIVGRKPLLVLGPLVSGAASVLLIQTNTPLAMIGVRLVDGLGAAAFWPVVFAAVGDCTTEENRSAGMGVMNVAYMVGLAFGPLTGGWINRLYSTPGHTVYHAAFYLSAGLFAAGSLMSLLLVPDGHAQARARRKASAEDFSGLATMARAALSVWRLLIVAFVTFLGIGILIPVVELYALDKYGIDQQTFGTLFVIPAVIIGLVAVPLGRMGDKWGRLRSVKVGMFLCAVAIGMVPAVESYYILAAGAIIVGIGFILAFPAWMALLADVCGSESRGSVLGAAGMAQGIGAILGAGAVAGGRIYHIHGLVLGVPAHEAPVLLSSALLGLGFILTLTVLKDFGRRSSMA